MTIRRSICFCLSFSLVPLLLLLAAAPLAAEEAEAQSRERTWKGYLWKDGAGRTRIGWPVVAMGVMAQPVHVFEPAFAARVAPLLSGARADWTFWNYRLEEKDPADLPALPRTLVRIRGRVQEDEASAPAGRSGMGVRTLRDARLETVEFLSDEWLRAWSVVFREEHSPWRYRSRPEADPAEVVPPLAEKLLAAARAMRAAPGPSDVQRARVEAVDPRARVVSSFREATEEQIVRWLREQAETYDLDLPGLEELGVPPPDGRQVQQMFMDAENRAAFLAAVREAAPDKHAELPVYYYEGEASSLAWAETTVGEVARHWDDARFLARRDLTRSTMGWRPGAR